MSTGHSPNQAPLAVLKQFEEDESLGRLNYEAFCSSMLEWLPGPPDFKKLSIQVQRGWAAAAAAVRAARP
jgi:hypothetical protein